jgi:DNA polymerase III gamma/tau subunit
MFTDKFNNDQTFLSQYFESALKNNSRLNHSFVFTGSDSLAQYFAAMQIAKVLNCKNGYFSDNNCTCTNCLWINQNRHPAVITISPIDYTYGNKDSKPSTVISVNQTTYLKESLSKTSAYYRVIIFTDALEDKSNEKNAEILWNDYHGLMNPPASQSDNDPKSIRPLWIPAPIKQETFNSAAPNSILKIIEEPEDRIIFFFLTNDKENIIDTIISRSQILPVKSYRNPQIYSEIINYFSEYFPLQSHESAINLSEKLLEISKQDNISIEELLESIQIYHKHLLEANTTDRTASLAIINSINKIEQSKKELSKYITPQNVLDSLVFSLIQ